VSRALLHPLDSLLRVDRLPHMWCPGCGIGITMASFLRAIKTSNVDLDKLVVVSGIGCTGRFSGYLNLDGAHTLHGRPIPFAMGVKLANPDLNVVVVSGDGDLVSIGGNHLIHAARRNLDILVILVNNMIYGMTGGQVAPTTPLETVTKTSPEGNIEPPLNIVKLIASIGANYVARWSITQPIQLERSIAKALKMRGFRFIEVVSICPEIFGRLNNFRNAPAMIQHLKRIVRYRRGIKPEEAEEEWNRVIITGEFVNQNNVGFVEKVYARIQAKVRLSHLDERRLEEV